MTTLRNHLQHRRLTTMRERRMLRELEARLRKHAAHPPKGSIALAPMGLQALLSAIADAELGKDAIALDKAH